MSDTDDTEELLLIPPDHFLIFSSDSEESFDYLPNNNSKTRFKNISVRVDKLKLCLEKLENVSTSEPSTRNESISFCNSKSKANTPAKHQYNTRNKYKDLALSNTVVDSYCKHNISHLSSIHYLNLDYWGENSLEKTFKTTPASQKIKTFLPPNLQRWSSVSSFESETPSDFSINSCTPIAPSKMDSDSSAFLSPEKKQDKYILSEIDQFLKNVESNRPNDCREESMYKWASENFLQNRQIDNIPESREHSDFSQMTVLPKSGSDCNKVSSFEIGSLKNSVPDFGYGMRDIMYSTQLPQTDKTLTAQIVQKVTSTPKSKPKPSFEEDNNDYLKCTSKEPENLAMRYEVFNEAFKRNHESPDVDNQFRIFHQPTFKEHSSQHIKDQTDPYKFEKPKSCEDNDTNNDKAALANESETDFRFSKMCFGSEQSLGNLPSLSDMWGVTSDTKPENVFHLQRFEEEKLRREHCEEIIQQLQKKLLEQQQKIAIAVKVDRSKDDALQKLKNALTKLSNKVSSAENAHLQQLEKINSNFKTVLSENEDLKQKTDLHKSDMSKAFQYAQDSQAKIKMIVADKDKTIHDLQMETDKLKEALKDKDDRYMELKESNALVVQLNKQISETATNLQNSIEKLKQDQILANEGILNLKKECESLQDETTLIKNERNDLRLIIYEEKSRNSHLDTQKNKLQSLLDSANNKMKSMESEFESSKDRMVDQKNEMKSFYQKQVENIVMGKLSEFQNQLNAAESLMDNEMQNKQREIAVQFAKQLQKIEQQHKLEVSLLEEKHKEEIKLYRIQLAQSCQTIKQLEDKLASYKNRRGLIAAQLHSVMENQWQQALKIITNGAPSNDPQNIQNNSESQTTAGFHQVSNKNLKHSDSKNALNPLNNIKSSNPANSSTDQECFSNYEHFEKPLKMQSNRAMTSGSLGDVHLKEDDIQRYIKLLLQKTPGVIDLYTKSEENSGNSKQMGDPSNFKYTEDEEYPTSDRNTDMYDRKLDRHAKPPWK